MNVSVVLPSFNRARLLPITIPTYFQEDVSEVILVDDSITEFAYGIRDNHTGKNCCGIH